MKLSQRSLDRLEGVHPELIAVAKRAAEATTVPFIITSGVRTAAQQNALYKRGASKLNGYSRKSRHQQGCAFDVAVTDDQGNVTWDWPPYTTLSKVIKQAARDLGVPIEWGGDWKSFKDGPHYQLPRRYVREYIADPDDDSRPVLKIGSSGTFVKQLQGNLPGCKPDGIFGRFTERAVKDEQRKAGLDPDGIVGPLTWAVLLTD